VLCARKAQSEISAFGKESLVSTALLTEIFSKGLSDSKKLFVSRVAREFQLVRKF
jgi:hypothetical protein